MIIFRWIPICILFILLGFHSTQMAEAESKTDLLLLQDLSGLSGKEGMVLTVRFSPGEASPEHRHNAHTFVYVLEGSVIFQVAGGQPVTLKAGETFYESPKDIHTVSKNASDALPAKFLVFFVKNKGAPPLIPIN